MPRGAARGGIRGKPLTMMGSVLLLALAFKNLPPGLSVDYVLKGQDPHLLGTILWDHDGLPLEYWLHYCGDKVLAQAETVHQGFPPTDVAKDTRDCRDGMWHKARIRHAAGKGGASSPPDTS
jgi:hypothetical protein